MKGALLAFILSLAFAPARAGHVRLLVTASGHANEHVLLLAYTDLFTLRTQALTTGRSDADGRVTLEADVDRLTKVSIRLGDVAADLWINAGEYDLEIPPPGPKTARSISGNTRIDPVFRSLDPMDVNALIGDLNLRLDAFIAEDLATDQAAGMQAIDIKRRENEPLHSDSVRRPNTLFITPSWSGSRVDTFEMKLRRFYADVKDPWFWNDLEYGIAGLRFGPRSNDRELWERYLKGRPVLYDVPEYVRFISAFYEDHLLRYVFRSDEQALVHAVKNSELDSLKGLFAKNDFLRTDDRLCELVVLMELYTNCYNKLLDKAGIMRLLNTLATSSTYTEHRTIASNMIWDLTAMRADSDWPSHTVRSLDGVDIDLQQELSGPTFIAVIAGWCTYCEQEMVALERLHQEYGKHVRVIGIHMDATADELKRYLRAHPDREWTWFLGADDPLLMETLRIRSLPAFFLLNDRTIARSPAPPPSNGLAALFFQLKAKWEEENKLKPDQGRPQPRRR